MNIYSCVFYKLCAKPKQVLHATQNSTKNFTTLIYQFSDSKLKVGNLCTLKQKIALIIHRGTLDKLLCAFNFWGLNIPKNGVMEKAGLHATYNSTKRC
jgi:hypothetical protein